MNPFIKQIIPPIFYDGIRRIIKRDPKYSPRWNTLSYDPLKGIKIFFDPNGSWQKKMMSNSYDSFLFKDISEADIKGNVIFDIGAHIGFHSLYFARLSGKDGTVIAFEPNRANAERMRMIVDSNPDISKTVKVMEVAVSDRQGSEEMMQNEDVESGRSTGTYIGRSDTFWNESVYVKKGFTKSSVKTVTIDSLVASKDVPPPNIIKIDVEGAEYLVLLGAKNTLISKKPKLYIEIHSIQNMFNVLSLLESLSYKATLLNCEPNSVCFVKAEYQV